jgi:hypothetical protein
MSGMVADGPSTGTGDVGGNAVAGAGAENMVLEVADLLRMVLSQELSWTRMSCWCHTFSDLLAHTG